VQLIYMSASSDVTRFVNSLLETPPAAAHSVQLELDTGGDVQGTFEVLLLIMTEILKRWYAPPISISSIAQEDLVRLIGYFASFGIKFNLDIRQVPRVIRLNNREYLQQSRLNDMKFQVINGDQLYTATFSKLITA